MANPITITSNQRKIDIRTGGAIPAKGNAGQFLRKKSDKSFDYEWADSSGANTLEEVLTNNNDGGALQIKNIANPTDAQDAATKDYVDNNTPGASNLDAVLTVGNSAGSKSITNLLNPTNNQDAATKIYVDNLSRWRLGGNTLGANSSLGSIDNFALQFITNNTIRWTISNTGILEATGAQTIRTSTGDLTIATNAANGNILLTPNNTGGVWINPTGTPTAKFYVRGNGNTSSTTTARFERNDSSNIMLLRDDGIVRFGSNGNAPFLVPSNGGSQDIAGTAMIFARAAANGIGRSFTFTDNVTSLTANSSTLAPVSIIQHTSSAFEFSVLDLVHTVNQTGTATGVIRGILSNPSITSAYNYKAFTFRSVSVYTPNAAITTYDFSEIFPNINASVNNQIIRGLTINLSGSDGVFTGVQRAALNLIGGVLRVAQLSADPAAATNGDIYYNTTTNKFRGYENGAWANLI